tara:strand:+ start:1007 stop:1366 length:360 start_codon:yes stop_codon:yes gene_type:complete
MLLINIPDSPYSEQNITLDGLTLQLILKYNIINSSWYLDIKTGSGKSEILSGIKVTPNRNLTGRHLVQELSGGDLWCLRSKNDFSPIDRDNFGEGEAYNLLWIPNSEVEEAELDGILQL